MCSSRPLRRLRDGDVRLILGLENAKDTGINMLNIKGDSDLVVLQIKNQYQCKNDRLRKYRNATWDTMEWFDALNIQKVHREMNGLADKLAVAASTLHPLDETINGMERWKSISDLQHRII